MSAHFRLNLASDPALRAKRLKTFLAFTALFLRLKNASYFVGESGVLGVIAPIPLPFMRSLPAE